jgi:hypothetical protein
MEKYKELQFDGLGGPNIHGLKATLGLSSQNFRLWVYT